MLRLRITRLLVEKYCSNVSKCCWHTMPEMLWISIAKCTRNGPARLPCKQSVTARTCGPDESARGEKNAWRVISWDSCMFLNILSPSAFRSLVTAHRLLLSFFEFTKIEKYFDDDFSCDDFRVGGNFDDVYKPSNAVRN